MRRFLRQGKSGSLLPAVSLGREAVALGLEILQLALIHEQALIAQIVSIESVSGRDRIFRRAAKFFAEAIIPMEETHSAALEQNARLTRLNQSLEQHARDLLASNRKLKSEIAKRKAVEKALSKSERHSSRLLDQSQRLQTELRHLSHRILSAQEEDRKHISRELHDLVAQTLTGINVHLSNLRVEAAQNTKGLTKNIARTQKLVEKSVDKVHRFARELRPAVLDDLGLIPALHSFMKSFAEEIGLRVSLTAFAGVEELSNAKRTVLYRVAQEALTNVVRHARASHVDVNIRRLPNAACMTITDNGISFQVERVLLRMTTKSLGLLGMRERVEMVGGRFRIESTPGQGTTICVEVPFTNNDRVSLPRKRSIGPLKETIT